MNQKYLNEDSKPREKYFVHCDYCGFHKLTTGTDIELKEIPNVPVPAGAPKLIDKKIIIPKARPQLKKFKCPTCGRGITPRKSNMKKPETENEQKD